MYKAIKNGKTALLSNEVQAAAYRKSGWSVENQGCTPAYVIDEPKTKVESLKAEADKRGITYHWNSGVEKLESLIEDYDRSHTVEQ